MSKSNSIQLAELEKIHGQVRRCRKCFLYRTRRKAVPGEGPLDAPAMLIGEAPGAKEDAVGRPFAGLSGKFLDLVLEQANIHRERIFITSTIKCLPVPAGRPTKTSIEACNPYLLRQIELINPAVVCALGKVAAATLLGITGIAKSRGRLIHRAGRLYLVTYHPAAARRFPALRACFHKDIRLLAREGGW